MQKKRRSMRDVKLTELTAGHIGHGKHSVHSTEAPVESKAMAMRAQKVHSMVARPNRVFQKH